MIPMTMEEHFDRVLDELCWLSYFTSVPADRRGLPPLPPPSPAVGFMTSPLVAVTLLDRYTAILADRIWSMAVHERQLREINSWSPGLWKRLSPADQCAYREEAATYHAYLDDHNRRIGVFYTTPAHLRKTLGVQASWIWRELPPANREELLMVAEWCTNTGRLQQEITPPRAITPAMAAAQVLASNVQRVSA